MKGELRLHLGIKDAKKRVTILTIANATGDHKLQFIMTQIKHAHFHLYAPVAIVTSPLSYQIMMHCNFLCYYFFSPIVTIVLVISFLDDLHVVTNLNS